MHAHGFRTRLSEERLQVAAGQQLEDDEARMLIETDADEVHDVGVMEFRHDDRLHEEVHLGLVGRQLGQRLRSR